MDKIQLRVTEVPFIGHTATANGLKPGPGKIEAIVNMLPRKHLSEASE